MHSLVKAATISTSILFASTSFAQLRGYTKSIRNYQAQAFDNEHSAFPELVKMANETLVLAVEGELSYMPLARWNLYWIDPVSFDLKHSASTSAELVMFQAVGNHVLTVERGGEYGNGHALFRAYDHRGNLVQEMQLNEFWSMNKIVPFTSSKGNFYFDVRQQGYVWNPAEARLKPTVSGLKPTAEMPNHQLINVNTVFYPDTRKVNTVLNYLDDTGNIKDRFEFPFIMNLVTLMGVKTTEKGTLILLGDCDPMHDPSRNGLIEIDVAEKKVIRRMRADHEEGRNLQLFVMSRPFKNNTHLAVNRKHDDRQEAVIFDANGNVQKRIAFNVSGWVSGRFMFLKDNKTVKFDGYILDSETFEVLHSLEYGHVGHVFLPATEQLLTASDRGIVIYTPTP